MLLTNLGAQLGVSTLSCSPAAISEALDYDRVLSDPSTLAASFFLVNHIVIEAVERPLEATSASLAAHLKNRRRVLPAPFGTHSIAISRARYCRPKPACRSTHRVVFLLPPR